MEITTVRRSSAYGESDQPWKPPLLRAQHPLVERYIREMSCDVAWGWSELIAATLSLCFCFVRLIYTAAALGRPTVQCSPEGPCFRSITDLEHQHVRA